MQLYFAIARQSFRRAIAYRSAYVAGLLTNAFFGALLPALAGFITFVVVLTGLTRRGPDPARPATR